MFADVTGLKRLAVAASRIFAPNYTTVIICETGRIAGWREEIDFLKPKCVIVDSKDRKIINPKMVIINDKEGNFLKFQEIDFCGQAKKAIEAAAAADFVIVLRSKEWTQPEEIFTSLVSIDPTMSFMEYSGRYLGETKRSLELKALLSKKFIVQSDASGNDFKHRKRL
jgi:hypothetical protein